ncbi:hypothetical protein [Phytoactinopolyspora mesophila]|uniref:Uncharacterized protein n=1 Tax=Phytoactinopolyspora mesophila TaxID=2650750 RepID=A0A7K3MAA0_9ACTN|nr:hypothetical protein [Phytoactinopolyspora mesophila]NDL60229.1 hypothetical protein [Phytoactinopolyspora mesophila]
MHPLFFNGPVQNGPFTFQAKPGKAVGIRLAAALNAILGAPLTPHLWNTVTLDGDLRHRAAVSGGSVTRAAFEARLIAAKYAPHPAPAAGTVTDTDPEVAVLALELIEENLRTGTVTISRETVPTCRVCGHMTGQGTRTCNACGCTDIRDRVARHLIAKVARDRPVLDRADIHSSHRAHPKHLQNTAANVASRLFISRTRDHGIDLSPLGLPRLVLDPRVGVHATVLAAAHRLNANTAVMTITQNAANHIAAHGQHFRKYRETRLKYALHGHLPYDYTAILQPVYAAYRATAATRRTFETWFLPLFSLKEKGGTRPGLLPQLFKHFMRAYMSRPSHADPFELASIHEAVAVGETDWLTRRRLLGTVLAAPSSPDMVEAGEPDGTGSAAP